MRDNVDSAIVSHLGTRCQHRDTMLNDETAVDFVNAPRSM